MDYANLIYLISGSLVAIAAIVGYITKLSGPARERARIQREVATFILGRPATALEPAVPNLNERLDSKLDENRRAVEDVRVRLGVQDETLAEIRTEWKPNGVRAVDRLKAIDLRQQKQDAAVQKIADAAAQRDSQFAKLTADLADLTALVREHNPESALGELRDQIGALTDQVGAEALTAGIDALRDDVAAIVTNLLATRTAWAASLEAQGIKAPDVSVPIVHEQPPGTILPA